MFRIKDQLQRIVTLVHHPPRSIVSLVPSQTELLFDLGLDKEVAGITKFCVHPEQWFRQKQRVGGTKNVDIAKVKALQPDLIIANKEENVKEQVEALSAFAPVWISDVNTLVDALAMINTIGAITARETRAAEITTRISQFFKQPVGNDRKIRVCYLIWKDPYMTVGGDTFISDMLAYCGFENVCVAKNRYPVITVAEIKDLNPAVVLLSSEPFPFKEKHIDELKHVLPGVKVMLADGEMFSWYGSRLLYAADYFRKLRTVLSD
ncbi:ABC transporter substrate-binding protein [Panacibacter sp. DH6]|uniref:ABC transporter substrate-binding protein n=1 Tax=Panacibacter microcysteis TaxID=2793269 RepID=A0A931H0D1_9BACT|nr:helical backbone metal receptor [Panacibacter microcysteis]MBG9378690.1 ABC transporter substrate-binding protein [Panacibacter microcysteis]